MQQELNAAHPLLQIQILGINEKGLELSNSAITDGRDLPWLQDRDDDGNDLSDVWHDLWDITYRDVVVLEGDNSVFGTYNLTINDLATPENYQAMRALLVDAAMETQKPWMNANDPLDVNGDGSVHPLDVLLVINKINEDGNGELPAPSGTTLPSLLFDCNGDNILSPLDVIQIVNYLNSQSMVGEGESNSPLSVKQDDGELHRGSPKFQPLAADELHSDWERSVDDYFVAAKETEHTSDPHANNPTVALASLPFSPGAFASPFSDSGDSDSGSAPAALDDEGLTRLPKSPLVATRRSR